MGSETFGVMLRTLDSWPSSQSAALRYLALILPNPCSMSTARKVVGWAFGQQQTADLVIQALNMALITRKPQGVINHSDQGSQPRFN